MRKKTHPLLEKCRIRELEKPSPVLTDYIVKNKGNVGVFEFRQIGTGKRFFVLSSDSGGWDHVSVHILPKGKKKALPTWNDMCFIKNLFFDPEETVIQYHPKESKYVNIHPETLHLWKIQDIDFPEPPLNLL